MLFNSKADVGSKGFRETKTKVLEGGDGGRWCCVRMAEERSSLVCCPMMVGKG